MKYFNPSNLLSVKNGLAATEILANHKERIEKIQQTRDQHVEREELSLNLVGLGTIAAIAGWASCFNGWIVDDAILGGMVLGGLGTGMTASFMFAGNRLMDSVNEYRQRWHSKQIEKIDNIPVLFDVHKFNEKLAKLPQPAVTEPINLDILNFNKRQIKPV